MEFSGYLNLFESKNQWLSFPMLTFWEFSASNSCYSISHQQETNRCHMSNSMIMWDRWFGFRESRIPTVPYSYCKYYNYTVITLTYTLTLFHYMDNHQQPLWLILRWLHHDHIGLEPSFQHFSSFRLCIRQLLMCSTVNHLYGRRWSEHLHSLRQ